MKARFAAALVAALAAMSAPAAAAVHDGPGPHVDILFNAFAQPQVSALVGDTVSWMNAGAQAHTVTAQDESWSSHRLALGAMFSRRFASAGTFAYYCRLHPFMTGQVDVTRVLLEASAGPAVPNRPFTLGGRAALAPGTKLTIEGDDGSGFVAVGSTTVAPDRTFRATVTPRTTTTYRVVVAGDASSDASPAQRVLVVDRAVRARVARRGRKSVVLMAEVVPGAPGATVVLQLRLRDRFGWWPVAKARLDRASRARFVLPARQAAPARVVLTLRDGQTPVAASPPVRLRPVARHHR